MATVTIYSEPLVESFGKGFSPEQQAQVSYSGDALNMAGAVTRGLEMLGNYSGNKEKHEVTVLCGLGNDDRGEAIKHFMEKEIGVSTRHAITLEGHKTAGYVISREEGGDKRSVAYENRGVDSPMCQFFEPGHHSSRANAALKNVAERTDIFIVTGIGASRIRDERNFQRLIDTAAAVKKRGGMVIVDFNHRFDAEGKAKLWVDNDGKPLPNEVIRKRMDKLFALANLSYVAHDEIWPVYGDLYKPPLVKQDAPDHAPMIDHLKQLEAEAHTKGARHLFFKRGKEGGTLFYDDGGTERVFHTTKNAVETVDRNGGGDALIGGTVAGLLRGYSIDQAVNIGQKMAGQVVQHPGGVIREDFLPKPSDLDVTIHQPPKIPHYLKRPTPHVEKAGKAYLG